MWSLFFNLLPYLISACLLVGAYSKWLNAAPASVSILPSIIGILMSGMGASEDCAAAAALAFRHICDGIVFTLPNLTSLPSLFTTKHNNDIITSMHIPQNMISNFSVVSWPWQIYFGFSHWYFGFSQLSVGYKGINQLPFDKYCSFWVLFKFSPARITLQ